MNYDVAIPDDTLAREVFNRIENLLSETEERVCVIGIDGPTAAGKTILADCLAEIFKGQGRPCWSFRLDWTLAGRKERVADLAHLRKAATVFAFEAEIHMRLGVAENFLRRVKAFNEQLADARDAASIPLDGLYSRADGGTCTGSDVCQLKPGLIILVEGHYSLRTELHELINFNTVLLANSDELILRKIARVEGYRGSSEAEDYFWRIDLPSYRHHLLRYGANPHLVIDNTDFFKPVLHSIDYITEWLDRNPLSPEYPTRATGENLDLKFVLDRIFSNSTMSNGTLRGACASTLETLLQWDRHVGDYMRLSIDAIETDLLTLASEQIRKLNSEFASRKCSVELGHTNAFHNIFHRNLPASIGVKVSCDGQCVYLLIDVLHDCLLLQTASRTGYLRFRFDRELGTLASSAQFSITDQTPHSNRALAQSDQLVLLTPTPFMQPGFLKGFEFDPVYTGREDENITASRALERLFGGPSVWIHRFSKFSELKFFKEIVKCCGANAFSAGNYLVVLWSSNADLRAAFDSVRQDWSERIGDAEETAADQNRYDRILDSERAELEQFVSKSCSEFRILDGHLFCLSIDSGGAQWVRMVSQLSSMLMHSSRLVRKRATQFILKNFPNLSLPVNKLWDDVPHGAREQIPLENFVEISPTILGEVYLWLALRNEASAILGANVYDIRSQSLDCNAYLSAASEKGTPIVLQGSLNALGQRETDEDGTEVHGYLKPSGGALDLSKAVLTAARDKILLEGAIPPLFGIGLDHVDIRQDRPKGRAKRFLHDAVNNGAVTHFVLDGSALFDAKDRSSDEMEAAFGKIANYATDLLDEQESLYIFDHEVCAGELNYVGSDSSTFIPSGDEMFAFAKIYREAARSRGVGAVNARPTLIIGNLGTTHHSFDTGDITVEAAVDWGSRIKSFNFVSAVLHGTTNSHPDILARATKGCHKVNVAGDFLRTLVQGLPNTLRDEVESGPAGAKYMLPEIRDRMDLMPVSESKQLLQSLKAHARSIIDTIRSPRLTPIDVNYFRYMFYRYEPNHVDTIVDALLSWKANKPKVSFQDRSDPEAAYAFSASLIEVPFGPSFEEIAKILWEEGVRNFHIDAGDGRFISREINGLEKAKYLRKTFAGVTLHAHLMMEEPHVSQSPGKSPLEEYIDAGCSGIAIHERAFANKRQFHNAIQLIQSRDVRAGVIVETSQHIDDQFWQTLCDAGIDWCVVMGVPIGYGGQIFDQSTINRISSLNWYARRDGRPFLIEVDGGLTLESLRLCCNAGGQIFAGWSIIRGSDNEEIRIKYRAVRDILQKRSY